jgi:hypothetical protein
MITFNIKVPKKRGRPVGSKNKPGHRAGGYRRKENNEFLTKVARGLEKFFESPWKKGVDNAWKY